MNRVNGILEGLSAIRVNEAASKNYVTVVKCPRGLTEKDRMDIVSHVFGPNLEDMSLNVPDFQGMNIKISGVSKDGAYDVDILKSENKGSWSPYWTKELKKYDAKPYNNGFMLTGFKSSAELKAAAKRIEDSKKAEANAEIEAVKKYIGKDLKKYEIYDYEENDYLVKIVKQEGNDFIVQYASGDTKKVDAIYVLYDTDFDSVLEPMLD